MPRRLYLHDAQRLGLEVVDRDEQIQQLVAKTGPYAEVLERVSEQSDKANTTKEVATLRTQAETALASAVQARSEQTR